MQIVNIPNILSFLRIPLAFGLLLDSLDYRAVIICLAMLTDSLDGYLARRLKATSQTGAFLDPLADKFFVLFAIGIFFSESRLLLWQALTMLSRDIAVFCFGGYLIIEKKWSGFSFRSIISGKITTFLQFLVFLGLIFHIPIPEKFYLIFILLGVIAFLELYFLQKKSQTFS